MYHLGLGSLREAIEGSVGLWGWMPNAMGLVGDQDSRRRLRGCGSTWWMIGASAADTLNGEVS